MGCVCVTVLVLEGQNALRYDSKAAALLWQCWINQVSRTRGVQWEKHAARVLPWQVFGHA